MTLARAKLIFATHMQAARKRKLTAYELDQLTRARQTLRMARRPARNPKLVNKIDPSTKAKSNPRPTLIYGRILEIRAQKTQDHQCDAECKRSGHRYVHPFSSNSQIYGLDNGDVLITNRKR